ncbi:hypothetical protein [Shewanella sp. TC10]|uniref:hypothetical protein n=1 Tax=Shewanella sp. TC10 TaxID=1419739 RepID=UPI001E5AD806|nr:hypothetical protein [Shewanella sp. TC10]
MERCDKAVICFLIAFLTSLTNVYANDSLTLSMSGVIEERCVVGIVDSIPFDFSVELSHTANLSIECNLPMLIALRSDYGGLELIDGSVETSLVAEYQVELNIDSLNFSLKQKSKELIDEQRFITGADIPFNTSGMIKVSLFEPLKFAGEYQDTLHIDVYPNFVNSGI